MTALVAGPWSISLHGQGRGEGASSKLQVTIEDHGIRAVEISPDGKRLAVAMGAFGGSRSFKVHLYDATTGRTAGPSLAHVDIINCVAFSPDGSRILTGGEDDAAHVFDAATGKELRSPMGHRSPVVAVAFRPDGRTFYTATRRMITVWDSASLRPEGPSIPVEIGVSGLTVSPDGKWLLVGGDGDKALMLATATGTAERAPREHGSRLRDIRFSTDGKRILIAADQGWIHDASSWDQLGRIPFPVEERNPSPPGGQALEYASSIACSPDGGLYLVAFTVDYPLSKLSGFGFARLYDAATLSPIGSKIIHGDSKHPSPLIRVAFLPDGKSFLTASFGEIRIHR